MNLKQLSNKELADRVADGDPPASREVYRRLEAPQPVDTDRDEQVAALVAEVERLRRRVDALESERKRIGGA